MFACVVPNENQKYLTGTLKTQIELGCHGRKLQRELYRMVICVIYMVIRHHHMFACVVPHELKKFLLAINSIFVVPVFQGVDFYGMLETRPDYKFVYVVSDEFQKIQTCNLCKFYGSRFPRG